MFVHFLSGELWKGNDFAECSIASVRLAISAPLSPRTQVAINQAGHLVIGNFAPRVAGDQKIDLFAECSPNRVFCG